MLQQAKQYHRTFAETALYVRFEKITRCIVKIILQSHMYQSGGITVSQLVLLVNFGVVVSMAALFSWLENVLETCKSVRRNINETKENNSIQRNMEYGNVQSVGAFFTFYSH